MRNFFHYPFKKILHLDNHIRQIRYKDFLLIVAGASFSIIVLISAFSINTQRQAYQSRASTNQLQQLKDELFAVRAFSTEDTTSLRVTAEKRKQLMIQTFRKDPKAFFQNIITEEEHAQLPQFLQNSDLIEKTIKINERATVYHIDQFKLKKSEDITYLGKKRLHIANQGEKIQSDSIIKGRVVGFEDQVFAEKLGTNANRFELAITPPADMAEGFSAQSTSNEHSAIVMMINFQDTKEEPVSQGEINDMVFRRLKDYYLENSRNKVLITGKTVGWYTIPYTFNQSAEYQPIYDWADAADKIAQENGVDLSKYSKRIYVLPKSDNLGKNIDGLGTVENGIGKVWLHPKAPLDTFAHEYGHTMRVGHANERYCQDRGSDGTYTNCYKREYYDFSSAMGLGNALFNAPHRWSLNYVSRAEVLYIDSNDVGTYVRTLEPLNKNNSNLKIIKIRKKNEGDFYYLSVRNQSGYDQKINLAYTAGVNIHVYNDLLYDQSLYLAALTKDLPFYDEKNNIRFTLLQKNADGSMQLRIEMGQPNTSPEPTQKKDDSKKNAPVAERVICPADSQGNPGKGYWDTWTYKENNQPVAKCICNTNYEVLSDSACTDPNPLQKQTQQQTNPSQPLSCSVGQTCSQCGAGGPGKCDDCGGGWCNGGQCSTCGTQGSGTSGTTQTAPKPPTTSSSSSSTTSQKPSGYSGPDLPGGKCFATTEGKQVSCTSNSACSAVGSDWCYGGYCIKNCN